jgi:hypothetical protein
MSTSIRKDKRGLTKEQLKHVEVATRQLIEKLKAINDICLEKDPSLIEYVPDYSEAYDAMYNVLLKIVLKNISLTPPNTASSD